jgi:hypothetical protein
MVLAGGIALAAPALTLARDAAIDEGTGSSTPGTESSSAGIAGGACEPHRDVRVKDSTWQSRALAPEVNFNANQHENARRNGNTVAGSENVGARGGASQLE